MHYYIISYCGVLSIFGYYVVYRQFHRKATSKLSLKELSLV